MLEALEYKPVSSIRQEVAELRRVLESGMFPDIDASEHYNMKFMDLGRSNDAYRYFSR
jgi:hypothetical protein